MCNCAFKKNLRPNLYLICTLFIHFYVQDEKIWNMELINWYCKIVQIFITFGQLLTLGVKL